MAKKKKRILIFSHAMELGGAERVLLGLLETIDTNFYEVDLFLMRHEGELLRDIPEKVHLLPEIPAYSCLAVPINTVLKKGQLAIAVGRFLGKTRARRRCLELGIKGENDIALEYSHKYTERFMPEIGFGSYDLAISFLTPHYFVQSKVIANVKIAWIHTDYSVLAVDRESELKMWAAYDSIVSISPNVTKAFVKVFPELEDKIIELPHFMPVEYIRKKADEPVISDIFKKTSGIKLLSIGRFCYQKNFDNIPRICKTIVDQRGDITWFIIGYGDEALIQESIKETQMEKHVIILGKKDNPYPYIKACDVYVQPSRYEGRSVSVLEAQILGKPTIITAFPTSASQLRDKVDGVIVPLDNEGCAEGILNVLNENELIEDLKRNCMSATYDGSEGIKLLYSLF